jgi:hypothetical protein
MEGYLVCKNTFQLEFALKAEQGILEEVEGLVSTISFQFRVSCV